MASTNKLIVGIFVGGCLLLFGVGLFLIGNSNQLFTKSFNVQADFSKITGIQSGGKVRVAGMDAGTVTGIDVPARPGAKFRIHFRIVEKLHPIVRQDSIATIQTDGLLGSKYLQIEAGSDSAQLALNNSLIPSTEPFDWGDLMDQVSSAVKQANVILAGVKDQVNATLVDVQSTIKSADHLIKGADPKVRSILASADKIGADLRDIVDGVQAGKGTVGALLKDHELYDTVKGGAEQAKKVLTNLRETSAGASRIVKKVDESDMVPEIQRTVKTLQNITEQVKAAVEKFQSAGGGSGMGENLQRTLADAHEAMSDLSDDTEALKHNFLFRGFFKNRGFYDLAALTTPEYRSPTFAKGFKKQRVFLESASLFEPAAKGAETLSAAGKARLDEAMTALLAFPRNGPLIVEGFAGEGAASQQYLLSRRRAERVQTYLIARFRLRPAYVGVISMGGIPLGDSSAGGYREGVGLVSFYK